MNLVTLLNQDSNYVATGQLVYGREETQDLKSLFERLEKLDSLLEKTESEVAILKEKARVDGYARGYDEGKAEARNKLSKALLVSQREVLAAKTDMRPYSVQLAVNIVRKIGLELGKATCITQLAAKCAEEMSSDDYIKLHVSPEVVDDVSANLSSLLIDSGSPSIDVVVDEELDSTACILSTAFGTVHAGLEDQLSIIQNTLIGSTQQESSHDAE